MSKILNLTAWPSTSILEICQNIYWVSGHLYVGPWRTGRQPEHSNSLSECSLPPDMENVEDKPCQTGQEPAPFVSLEVTSAHFY